MQRSGDELPPEYLSTHPSYETRIEQLLTHMPEARRLYERARLAPVADLPRPDQPGEGWTADGLWHDPKMNG